MKFHLDFEMTPDEARKVMGLPDVSAMQKTLVAEMERRMLATLDTAADPEALFKSWFNWGNQGMEQFQRFMQQASSGAKEPRRKA
ncbi:MAG TPA: DUF6489 family protein [Rhizomicrobium sp.]